MSCAVWQAAGPSESLQLHIPANLDSIPCDVAEACHRSRRQVAAFVRARNGAELISVPAVSQSLHVYTSRPRLALLQVNDRSDVELNGTVCRLNSTEALSIRWEADAESIRPGAARYTFAAGMAGAKKAACCKEGGG